MLCQVLVEAHLQNLDNRKDRHCPVDVCHFLGTFTLEAGAENERWEGPGNKEL